MTKITIESNGNISIDGELTSYMRARLLEMLAKQVLGHSGDMRFHIINKKILGHDGDGGACQVRRENDSQC